MKWVVEVQECLCQQGIRWDKPYDYLWTCGGVVVEDVTQCVAGYECFSAGHHIAAIESAILFESGFDDIVDRVVMVHAPLETRIARVMERDKTTRDKVIGRINSQMDDREKLSKSDFIIENDGTVPLNGQIDKLISDLHLIKDVQYLV